MNNVIALRRLTRRERVQHCGHGSYVKDFTYLQFQTGDGQWHDIPDVFEDSTAEAKPPPASAAAPASAEGDLPRSSTSQTLKSTIRKPHHMTQREQINALATDLDRIVNKYRDEFDLSYAAVIGVLHMKAFLLCAEADEAGDDGEDDGKNFTGDQNDE